MKKMPGDIIILHMCTINNNYMIYDYWDTIEWGELGWFSEKVEFSKKKYLGLCLKNICRKSLLGSYFKMSNATVCYEILVLSFLKKPVLSQFTPVCCELGQWKVSNHSIIIFNFVPICMDLGCIGGISELLKNKNTLCWSQQFFTIYKFNITGVFFSSFFISMLLVHYIKPLSPHSTQRRCFFTFRYTSIRPNVILIVLRIQKK